MQSENISPPIYVECYKMYLSKVCVQEFGHIVPGLDIQPGIAVLQRRVINQFLARDRYERMAQWLRHLLVSPATWNGFSQGAETPCRP